MFTYTITMNLLSEDSKGEMTEEVVVGPVPKPQVTLSKKDYGKVRCIYICISILYFRSM